MMDRHLSPSPIPQNHLSPPSSNGGPEEGPWGSQGDDRSLLLKDDIGPGTPPHDLNGSSVDDDSISVSQCTDDMLPSPALQKAAVEQLLMSNSTRVRLMDNVRSKSPVWNIFRLVYLDGRPQALAACVVCNGVVTYNSRTGTGGLQRHRCVRLAKEAAASKSRQSAYSPVVIQSPQPPLIPPHPPHSPCGAPPALPTPPPSSSPVSLHLQPLPLQPTSPVASMLPQSFSMPDRMDLAEMALDFICKDLRPLGTLDDPGFRALAQSLVNVGAENGSTSSMVRHILPSSKHLYHSTMLTIVDHLKRNIGDMLRECDPAFSLDLWEAQGRDFVTVHAHFMTSRFQLKRYVLGSREWVRRRPEGGGRRKNKSSNSNGGANSTTNGSDSYDDSNGGPLSKRCKMENPENAMEDSSQESNSGVADSNSNTPMNLTQKDDTTNSLQERATEILRDFYTPEKLRATLESSFFVVSRKGYDQVSFPRKIPCILEILNLILDTAFMAETEAMKMFFLLLDQLVTLPNSNTNGTSQNGEGDGESGNRTSNNSSDTPKAVPVFSCSQNRKWTDVNKAVTEAIHRLASATPADDGLLVPSAANSLSEFRERLVEISRFLKPFQECTNALSDTSIHTISSIPLWKFRFIQHCASTIATFNRERSPVLEVLLNHVSKWLKDLPLEPIHFMSLFLEPNFKSLRTLDEGLRGTVIDSIRQQLAEFSPEPEDLKVNRLRSQSSLENSKYPHRYFEDCVDSWSVHDEIVSYSTRRVPGIVDAPTFWSREEDCRSLKRLAQFLLAVPATSTVAEMRTNERMLLISQRRGNLERTAMDTILFLHGNYIG